MADPQRTEQPTPRRLEKAKKEGQFPASKEFVSGLVFLSFVWMLHAQLAPSLLGASHWLRSSIEAAFTLQPTVSSLYRLLVVWSHNQFLYLFLAGLALSTLTLALHFLITGLGFAPSKVFPDISRLSPLNRIQELPGQNFSNFMQSLRLLPIFAWLVYYLVGRHWDEFLMLPRMGLEGGLRRAGASIGDLLWKAAMVLFVLGSIDLIRQRRRWMSRLRMTKQEVREEQKDVEGNPLIRMRIRRLQRDAARKRMMQEVPKATAVIVNPTHYAVAIRYQINGMATPKVVAKGKNWLALRIRETAIRNQVPIVENPPLARALYAAADVGQEIPPKLYQAIAEILAYIFRLTKGNLPG